VGCKFEILMSPQVILQIIETLALGIVAGFPIDYKKEKLVVYLGLFTNYKNF